MKPILIAKTSKECIIDRKSIRWWNAQQDKIKGLIRDNKTRSRFTRYTRRSYKAKYPLLEQAVVDYIKEQRKNRQSLTGSMIIRKTKALFHNLYHSPDSQFAASKGLFTRVLSQCFFRLYQKCPFMVPFYWLLLIVSLNFY